MDTQFTQHEDVATKARPVTILVNARSVVLPDHKATGLQIKQSAMDQGVPIQLDFVLFKVNPGGHLEQISDDKSVPLHENEEFRAVAPDDNS